MTADYRQMWTDLGMNLQVPLLVPGEPQIVGALGAALAGGKI